MNKLRTVVNGDRWSQRDLYDYLLMKVWVGFEQLQAHLPDLSQFFVREFEGISEWRRDVGMRRAAVNG